MGSVRRYSLRMSTFMHIQKLLLQFICHWLGSIEKNNKKAPSPTKKPKKTQKTKQKKTQTKRNNITNGSRYYLNWWVDRRPRVNSVSGKTQILVNVSAIIRIFLLLFVCCFFVLWVLFFPFSVFFFLLLLHPPPPLHALQTFYLQAFHWKTALWDKTTNVINPVPFFKSS